MTSSHFGDGKTDGVSAMMYRKWCLMEICGWNWRRILFIGGYIHLRTAISREFVAQLQHYALLMGTTSWP
jgi:hypothetical protein